MKRSRPAVLLLLLAAGLVFMATGCGNTTGAAYGKQWTRTMEAFQSRVSEDDAKVEKLVEQSDIVGLIALVGSRIKNVETVTEEILELSPPEKYRDVHVLTLYYLLTVKDRLAGQNELNEAMLAENPTDDLRQIAESYAARSERAGRELGIEIRSAGLDLKELEK